MKSKKRRTITADAMLGAVAGINLASGLLADDLSSLKGISFGTGLIIFFALALQGRLQSKQKNKTN